MLAVIAFLILALLVATVAVSALALRAALFLAVAGGLVALWLLRAAFRAAASRG